MTTTIKYIGVASPYFEANVTGNQSSWKTGQLESREDAEAQLLLGTGLFSLPEMKVTAIADPATWLQSLSVSGDEPLMQQVLQRNTAVALGDSIFENGVITSASVATFTARNIQQIAAAILKQRLNIVADKGVSSNTLALMRDRFNSDVTPYAPAWVIVEGCSNDIGANRTAVQMLADLDAIYVKCRQINARMVFVNSSCGAFSTDAQHTEWYAFNLGCLQRHALQKGFFYAPMYFGAVDWTTAAGSKYCNIAANMTYDAARHPSAFGAHTVYAKSLERFFDKILPSVDHGMGGRDSSTTGDLSNLVINGMFYGTTGTSGTGNSGSIPTTWIGSRTGSIAAAFSVVARTDGGAGQWMTADLASSAAAADAVSITQSGSSFYSLVSGLVGRKVRYECDYIATASSGTIGQLEMQVAIKDSSGTLLFTAAANQIVGTEYLGLTTESGRMRTPDFVLPAGADRVVPKFILGTSPGGTANIKLGAMTGRVVA